MEISFFTPPVDAAPYCWLIEIGSRKVGVHQHGGWCMQLDGQLVFFNSEDKCLPLSPVLEIEEKKFFDFLESAVILNPAYSECIRKFPKELLLKHVFHTSFSGYWPERALAWLAADKNLQPLMKDELEKLVQNKVMPQGSRQKAQRMVQSIPSA